MRAARVAAYSAAFLVLCQAAGAWVARACPEVLRLSAASLRPGPWWVSEALAAACLTLLVPRLGRGPAWAWGLLLGGWLSNLADHLRLGAYADYLPLPGFYTNAADLGITLGAAALLLAAVRGSRPPSPS